MIKLSYQKAKTIFNKIKANNKANIKISKYMTVDIKKIQFGEAFGLSMQKNFPVQENWNKINRSRGAKMLDKYMSVNTFKKYVKSGCFRQDEKQNVYVEEIDKYKEAIDTLYKIFNLYFKKSIENGIEKIYLYPSSVDMYKISEHEQTLKAASSLYKEQWFLDILKSLDTTKS